MKIIAVISLWLLGFVLTSDRILADEDAPEKSFPSELTDSILREGVWIWRSGHHVSGMGIQKVVRIRKSGDKWSLVLFTISNTRESFQKGQPPQVRTDGPYPIQVTNGVLHIERPSGTLKYSCRFHGDLLQFPAVTRTEAGTFNFTVSEVAAKSAAERDGVNTWSYTWKCSSNPSTKQSGTVDFVAQGPQGVESDSCTYVVEKSLDGPQLVVRRTKGELGGIDRIVWHLKYFGLQIYESESSRLDRPGLQETYMPADDAIQKQLEEWTKE